MSEENKPDISIVKKKPVICLVMIVKDEERVIGRCLRALKPYVDCWIIQDTGSSDSTKKIILETMDVGGLITDEPFQGFSHNRTLVMQQAREKFPEADYLLMIDADDTWIVENGFAWPEAMNQGAYSVRHVNGTSSFYRPALTRAKLPWKYKGAAHEQLVCDMPWSMEKLSGVSIRCGNDGHRRTTEGADKYRRIAGILEKEMDGFGEYRRTVFYLAQSYKDCLENEKALELYRRRAEMGGFREEVWFSLYTIGNLLEKLKRPFEEIRDAYIRAYKYRPSRAEALYALAKLHRQNKDPAMAHAYAAAAVATPYPDDNLFVDESVYSWRSLDEYAISADRIGMLDKARKANLELLGREDLKAGNRRRVEDNFTFSSTPITRHWDAENPRVHIALSTYKADPKGLRDAVESIIAQTHENWSMIIFSDGDDTPPWDALEGIDDPRIVFHHFERNYGQFAIYDSCLKKNGAQLFAIQDDDDVSAPNRLERLIQKMRETNADVVFSDIERETLDGKVVLQPSHPEWLSKNPDKIVHVGSHVGLWKIESLRAIGGYYGGFRLGADTVVVGLMAQLGRTAFLHEPLYRAKRTPDSMTAKADTAIDSEARDKVWADIHALWDSIKDEPDRLKAAFEKMTERAAATFKSSSKPKLRLVFSQSQNN